MKTPTNLDEAVSFLIDVIKKSSVEDKKQFENTKNVSQYHHSLGREIRNNWNLWSDSKLKEWFKNKGVWHPDDMSAIILDATKAKIDGKEFDLESEIKYYQEYWEKSKESKGCTFEVDKNGKVKRNTIKFNY